jgi:hypothetical protein
MPLVRVVDMRKENRKQPGVQILSQQLKEAIQTRLEKREQTILFLNRRGYSSSLQCTKCGYVAECPNCSISLTYHRGAQKLLCHICNYEARVPSVCPEPKCGNPAIRYSGLGTERVEDTLTKLFPHARIKRMDSDALKKKEDYRRILGDFRLGKIDILVSAVGTGGTITGCYEAIHPRKPSFRAIAAEPKDSPVISQTLAGEPLKPGPHKIQGAGAGFIPKNLRLKDAKGNPQIVECVQVTNEDAFKMARRLAKEEGLLVGISTGANVWAAVEIAKRPENKGKMIVTIACSTGERYLSTPLAAEARAEVGG